MRYIKYRKVHIVTDAKKRMPALFYRTEGGVEPVRAWLKGLDGEDREIIGEDIKTGEFGWPVGMPVCRSVTPHSGLWEVRSSLPKPRIARVLFCIVEGRMVLLHGVIKKTRKTPKSDLDLAAGRMKEIRRTGHWPT